MSFFSFLKPIFFVSLLFVFLAGCGGGGDNGGASLSRDTGGGGSGNGSGSDPSLPPSLLAVESGTYRKQNIIDLTVTFIQPVLVRENTESPSIELTVGGQSRQAVYQSGAGTRSLTFRYTVQADDQDNDGIEIAETIDVHDSEINYTAFADLSGLTSNLVSLNVQTPTNLSSVKIVNGGNVELTASLYVQSNANLDIPVSFNEDVEVDTSGGNPEIEINVGGAAHRAIYHSGSGSDTLIFRYLVPENTSEGEVSLQGTVIYNGERITYSADSEIVVDSLFPPEDPTIVVRVDNTPPMIATGEEASVTSGNYVTGSPMDISISFSEEMLVATADGSTPPSIDLTIGGTSVTASYQSGSGSSDLIFRYTVQNGHTSGDSPIVITSTINPNDGSITDRAGNALADFTFTPPTNLASITVDGTIPTMSSFDISPGHYISGSEINVTLHTSENVTVDTSAGTPYLELSIAGNPRNADYVSGSGSMELIFRYSVQAGEESSGIDVSSFHFNSGTIRDNSNNDLVTVFNFPSNFPQVVIDTTAPTIQSVVIEDGIYSTMDISVHFSEPVNVDTNNGANLPGISLALGSNSSAMASYFSGDGEQILIFRYTAQSGVSVAAGDFNMISPLELNSGRIADLAGHALADLSFTVPANVASIQVDTAAPEINTVTVSPGTYASGDNIEFSLNFSEVITVDTANGVPRIALDVGGVDVFADYTSGSGSSTLVFSYTVEAGQGDNNGIGMRPSIVSNGGMIRDRGGNNAVETFTLPDNLSTVLVDAIAPEISTITVSDGNYAEGSNIDINVTFSKAMNVVGTAPTFSLRVGENDRVAQYESSNNNTLIFRYTVVEGENDLDGIDLTSISDPDGAIRDSLGNPATQLDSQLPSNLDSVLVDAIRPTITSVAIADGIYGGVMDFRMTFSEVVNVAGGSPAIVIDISGTSRNATLHSGSGETVLVFRYTIVTEDEDQDGIGMSTNLELGGATISDQFGNALTDRSFSAPSNIGEVDVDGRSTTINQVTVDAGTYKEGENIDIEIEFNRTITVTGAPSITINVEGDSKTAIYNSTASGTESLIFRYIVESGLNDDNGIEMTPSIDLNGGTIADTTSGDAPRSLNFTAPSNIALVKVDTTAPTINSVSIADGTYGDNMDITIVFSEPVTVDNGNGTPGIALTVDNEDREAAYESGSGTDTLIFRYVVGSNESGGVGMSSPSITLNSATITDAGGNAPAGSTATSIGFTAPGNLSSVLIDGVHPTLDSVTIPTGIYTDDMDISVAFSEPVTVGGNGVPDIALTIGTEARRAVYESGSGSATLIFRYSIVSGESDNGGIQMGSSITLNGATITDAGGNALVGATATSVGFTLPDNLDDIRVDKVAPTILSVSVNDGTYRGDMDITVVFSELVNVGGSGRPGIPLTVGANSRTARYESGSGSDTLIFRYRALEGDNDLIDGIEMTSPLELNYGTITDTGGNNAALAFNLPSNLGSVYVDRLAPAIDSVVIASDTLRAGENIDITVNLNEVVTVVTTNGTPKIPLNVGRNQRDALFNSTESTGTALVFRYPVVSEDQDSNGITMESSIELEGGTIKDAVGNDAATTFTVPDTSQVFVDNIVPTLNTVTIVPGDYYLGQNLDISVYFSEAVNVGSGGTPKISLRVGENPRDALYHSSDGTRLIFRYAFVSGDSDLDGIEMISTSIDSDGATIGDSGGNVVSDLSFESPTGLSLVRVDTTAPTIESVSIASGTHGGVMDFTVAFSETVQVREGPPFIPFDVDGSTRNAVFHSGRGDTLSFRYTVDISDRDTDGIEMTENLDLAGGTIVDIFGNVLSDLSFVTPANLGSVHVDGTATSINRLRVADGIYRQGAHIDFVAEFNRDVTVTGLPGIVINVGGSNKTAVYNAQASGGSSHVFSYTVEANVVDSDGIGMTTYIDFTNGTITDSRNVLLSSLNFGPPTNLSSVRVDGAAPAVDSITVTPGNYLLGQNVDITVNFDDAVNVETIGGDSNRPRLSLVVGDERREALLDVAGSTSTALLFRYTVVNGDADSDGITIMSPIDLGDGGTIRDGVNNNAVLTFTPPDSSQVRVDAVGPSIGLIAMGSGERFRRGEHLDVTVNFNEAVTVVTDNGTPKLSLMVGENRRDALYNASESSSTALVFRYTVGEDHDLDGIEVLSPIVLNGGTMTDAHGQAPRELTFEEPPTFSTIDVDGIVPRVTSAFIQSGTHSSIVSMTLNVDKPVTVRCAGSNNCPFVSIDVGRNRRVSRGVYNNTRSLIYESRFSTNRRLVFRNFTDSGWNDTNGIDMSSEMINLSGGSITDSFGNGINVNFTKPGNLSRVRVVTGGSIARASVSSGTRKQGDHIDITISFSQKDNLVVTGAPSININVGGTTKAAVYSTAATSNSDRIGGSLTFRYTVEAGLNDNDGIEIHRPINLNNGGSIAHTTLGNTGTLSGNNFEFQEPDNVSSVKVDTTVPTLSSVTVDSGLYNENIDISAVFSEPVEVGGSGTPSIALTIGTEAKTAAYVSVSESNPNALIFRYPTEAGQDGSTIAMGTAISLNDGTITDVAGNAPTSLTFTAPTNLSSVVIDKTAPSIDVLNSSYIAPGTYSGDMNFSLTYDEVVYVDDEGGTPRIELKFGDNSTPNTSFSRWAEYVSGSESNTLIFRYTVQMGEVDTDGIRYATNLDLNGGSIVDAAGNDLILGLSLDTQGVLVDGRLAIVNSVSMVPGSYGEGDHLDITVNYSESVEVVTANGTPNIALSVGENRREAVFNVGGSTDSALLFRYTLVEGEFDGNGVVIHSPIALNSGTIMNNGKNAVLTFTPPDTSGVIVDARSPAIDSVTTVEAGNYRIGEHLDVTVNLNKAVDVVSIGGVPKIVLTLGENSRDAFYEPSASTAASLVFRYTLSLGDSDNNGIGIASSIDLNGGTIRDFVGNNAPTSFTAPDSSQIFVDQSAPRATSVTISGPNIYKVGDFLYVTVHYNESLYFNRNNGIPKIILLVGDERREAFLFRNSANADSAISFRYSIQAGDFDDDGIEIVPFIDLNGGSIRDLSGIDITRSFTSPDSSQVRVDGVAPTIASVAIEDGSYGGGVNMDFTIVFSEAVTITGGSPFIPFDVNGSTKNAVLQSGSGTTFTFRYTVETSASDSDGIGITADLDLSGASIADTAGNALVDRSFSAPSNLSSVRVDGQAIAVAQVSVDAGNYNEGDHIDIEVEFSGNVTVTGSPEIGIEVGGFNKMATYNAEASGTGTATIIFRYVVEGGISDDNGIGMETSIDLNGGTILDSRSVAPSSLNFTLPTNLALVKVDNAAPSIDTVTTIAAGTYPAGTNLDITVNFNEDVEVVTTDGTPKIVVTVGSQSRDALYNEEASTARALAFRYTLVGGDTSNGSGIVIGSSIDKNGGTIRDLAGNDALDSFTAPDSSSVIADAILPVVDSVTAMAADTYRSGHNINFTFNFNEAITVVTTGGVPRVALILGDQTRYATYYESSSTSTALVFRYTVLAGDDSGTDGVVISSPLEPNGGTLRDSAGNDIDTSFTSPDTSQIIVDTVGPLVDTITATTGHYVTGSNIDITVAFSEEIVVTNNNNSPTISIDIGGATKTATYNSSSGNNGLVFRYTVEANATSQDGIEVQSPLVLNGTRIKDRAENNARRTFLPVTISNVTVNDTTAPTITSVSVAGPNYMEDDHLDIIVNWSEVVTIVTTENGTPPFIALDIGGTTKSAVFHRSEGNEFIFRYVVESGDRDTDGIGMTSPIVANDGTFSDLAGLNPSSLEFDVPGNLALVTVDVSLEEFKGAKFLKGLLLDVDNWTKVTFGDIDGDGIEDMLMGQGSGRNFSYYKGRPGNSFAKQTGNANPFRSAPMPTRTAPALANLDNDDDLELISGEWGGVIKFFDKRNGLWRRIGAHLFGSVNVGRDSVPTFANLDDDERLELVIGSRNQALHYYDAVGSDTDNDNVIDSWEWVQRTGTDNPFGSINVGFASPTFVNLDADSDLELVVGAGDGTLRYYDRVGSDTDNDSVNDTWTWTEQTGTNNPFNGFDAGNNVYPAFSNLVTDDAEFELLIVDQARGMFIYYDKVGTEWVKQVDRYSPFHGLDVGGFSRPTFANLDDDDDVELVIGEGSGSIKYYDLVGSDTDNDSVNDTWTWTEQTDSANPFNSIDVGDFSTPVFANLDDDDANLELVIGDEDGDLNYYDLVGQTWTEKTGTQNPFDAIDMEGRSSPHFANLDMDRDLELVIGESGGTLAYYDLINGTWTRITGIRDPFSGIDVGNLSNPFFVDVDDDADLELLIGHESPTFDYYDFTAGAWSRKENADNPFYRIGLRGANRTSISFGNVDTDPDLELVIGSSDGTLIYGDFYEGEWIYYR